MKRIIEKYSPAKFIVGILAGFLLLSGFAASEGFAAGRKYGVFIGINKYQGGISNLRGAVNDAKNLQSLMISDFGFKAADTKLLTDGMATRANIMDTINSFSSKTGEGDFFIVTYSGHGSLFPDEDSEEIDEKDKTFVDLWIGDDHISEPEDYYDSTICPVDTTSNSSGKAWKNQILDDELYNMFAPFAAKGVKVVFISDSCHSGSISKGEKAAVDAMPRFASPKSIFGGKSFKDITLKKPGIQRKVDEMMLNGGSYLAMSGSKDSEVSWDARLDGTFYGLFTKTMLDVVKSRGAKAKDLTYSEFMNLVQSQVKNTTAAKFPTTQTPQLNKQFGNASLKIFQP